MEQSQVTVSPPCPLGTGQTWAGMNSRETEVAPVRWGVRMMLQGAWRPHGRDVPGTTRGLSPCSGAQPPGLALHVLLSVPFWEGPEYAPGFCDFCQFDTVCNPVGSGEFQCYHTESPSPCPPSWGPSRVHPDTHPQLWALSGLLLLPVYVGDACEEECVCMRVQGSAGSWEAWPAILY